MTAAQKIVQASTERTIKPRRMAFDMTELSEKYFFRGNPILTTLMYSMSASFPDGERFFIDAVRHYQKDIKDPTLVAQIRGFIGQEAHHGSIHEDFNEQVESLGIAMKKVEKRFKNRIETAKRKLSPSQQLAMTAALEHVTATLAQWTLENPETGLNGDNNSPLREMLLWHAMEEIEHKAVAFDVYRAAVNNEKERIIIAKIVFRTFWVQMAMGQVILLWNDRKIPSIAHIKEAWQFMWGEGGFRSWAAPEFKRYLKSGFHPNDIDQNHLIEQWHEDYPEVAALQIV